MKITLLASSIVLALSLSACNNETSSNTNSNVEHKAGNIAKVSAEVNTSVNEQNESINALYQQATKTLFSKRALSATMYGLSTKDVGEYYANKMEDFSPSAETALRQELRALSKKIAAFPLTSTTQADKDTQQVMVSLTRYFAGDEDFNIGYIDSWMGLSPFIVNQINGPLINIPRNMQSDQPIINEKQALDYIARLGQFDVLIASIEEKLASDVAQNWLPPKVTVQGALRYLNGFISANPEQHAFVEVFTDKVNKIEQLTAEQKQQLIAQAIEKVRNVVYPAYQSMVKTTQALLTKARDESGIWAQPNGDKYYQDAIHQLGDSHLTAEQIHQLGLSEVKRISEEMDSILRVQGYSKGTVGERMVALNEEPRFLYEDSKAGRAEIIKDINGYIADITKKMAPVFKTTPSYQVEVRAYPVEIQDGAPGGEYTPPAVDGSKPGIYWINLRDMKANPKFGLKTLSYHEATPGHHWQIALNMDQASLPFLRRIAPYNAYTEGWALYSEQVAYELGMYENDPFGNLGRLQAELFRAVRLVVDTGLHQKRWTREQAISYMAEKTGSAKSDVIAEIERYMTWPGQALGYKLGMLKILSLRDHAKAVLGDNFDLSAFHDVVLLGGAVPMSVLASNVEQWIVSVKKES